MGEEINDHHQKGLGELKHNYPIGGKLPWTAMMSDEVEEVDHKRRDPGRG